MNEVQAFKSKADIRKIKAQLSGRDLLLFIVGTNTALRVSDLLTLKVGDLRNDEIRIKEGKTKKARVITLNKAIKLAVKQLVPASVADGEYAFKTPRADKPISRVQVWNILQRAVTNAGLERKYTSVGAHTLRKTWGYAVYTAGHDITLIMRALNHSSPRETLRYIGIEAEDVADVYMDVEI